MFNMLPRCFFALIMFMFYQNLLIQWRKVCENVEMWNEMCVGMMPTPILSRGGAQPSVGRGCRGCLPYQLFGRLPAIIWRAHSIINIKLASKMMNTTVPFWDSPATACSQIRKTRALNRSSFVWYLLRQHTDDRIITQRQTESERGARRRLSRTYTRLATFCFRLHAGLIARPRGRPEAGFILWIKMPPPTWCVRMIAIPDRVRKPRSLACLFSYTSKRACRDCKCGSFDLLFFPTLGSRVKCLNKDFYEIQYRHAQVCPQDRHRGSLTFQPAPHNFLVACLKMPPYSCDVSNSLAFSTGTSPRPN